MPWLKLKLKIRKCDQTNLKDSTGLDRYVIGRKLRLMLATTRPRRLTSWKLRQHWRMKVRSMWPHV
ncbi:MAG: hypothetical protein EA377_11545 [Phycisphaerales bacterium]|nr:MAG: hypothetical protein EA377_11545 [Phycisphaerales bacterium]